MLALSPRHKQFFLSIKWLAINLYTFAALAVFLKAAPLSDEKLEQFDYDNFQF